MITENEAHLQIELTFLAYAGAINVIERDYLKDMDDGVLSMHNILGILGIWTHWTVLLHEGSYQIGHIHAIGRNRPG